MSERMYRFILGTVLMALLYVQFVPGLAFYVGLLLFEGATDLRVPVIVSKIRKVEAPVDCSSSARFNIDSERLLRLLLVVILTFSLFMFKEKLWFLPWFVSFALMMAGITGICPMTIALRKAGFR